MEGPSSAPPWAPAPLALVTGLVMVAFAANSLLCRQALGLGHIGAVDFTAVRLLAGALVLWLLLPLSGRGWRLSGDWISSLFLCGYALCFSLAYVTLEAGSGALLLFGAVQVVMIGWGLAHGERLGSWHWVGVIAAFTGLIWFVSPGFSAPPLAWAALMLVSGLCWAAYSIRGRGKNDALRDTAGNFVRSIPVLLPLWAASVGFDASAPTPSMVGVALAIASGALASGLGYALWYVVLPHLTAGTAAALQLSVPVLAAIGGVLLLGEAVSLRLVLAATVVLGGVGLYIWANARAKASGRPFVAGR